MPAQQPIQPVEANVAAAAAAAATGCRNDLSEKAAQLAREKYPDTLGWPAPGGMQTPELWAARTRFLRENRWTLFDVNHDGLIDFEEYRIMMWANFLAGASAGQCIMKKDDYFFTTIGKHGEPHNGWSTTWIVNAVVYDYDMIDLDHKGFITKEDTKLYDGGSFYLADKFHRGYLKPEQRF